MTVLGIDPGIRKMGYGLINIHNQDVGLVDYGIITTDSSFPMEKRLKVIYDDILLVLDQFRPKVMSVEGGFFGKNIKSMMILGHARGMALLGAAHNEIPVYEYSPRKIKQSITGNGNATKEQVKYMVKMILNLTTDSIPDDASDALAIALCHTKQFRYYD